MKKILAVDPGTHKCGVAAVSIDNVLHREVVSRDEAAGLIAGLVQKFEIDEVIMGDGTGSGALIKELESLLSTPVRLVDEKHSSRRAKERFFQENPPKGLRRLIPHGLLSPDRPFDDYIAVMLAEEYLRKR